MLISKAYAQEIPRYLAMRVLVSEAADQGLRGMVCVAEVLRTRGSTRGFYGYKWNRHQQPEIRMADGCKGMEFICAY